MIQFLRTFLFSRIALLVLSDAFTVASAFGVGAILGSQGGLHAFLFHRNGVLKIALATGVYIACFSCSDLYEATILTNRNKLRKQLGRALVIGTLLLLLLSRFFPVAPAPPLLMLGVLFLAPIFSLLRQLYLGIVRASPLVQRTVIVGNGTLACSLIEDMQSRPDAGIKLMGYVDTAHYPGANNGLPYLGTPAVLDDLVEQHRVNQIIVAMGDRRGSLPVQELLGLKAHGVVVRDSLEVSETVGRKVPVDSARLSSWLLFSRSFRISKSILFYKRVCSIAFSSVGLVLFSPLLGLIALAIWLDSGRPIIFRQNRVGRDGKVFVLYKFRSMLVGSHGKPAQRGDQRHTRVGRILRRTRLDELPQLYNILCGDMCFIGPRPFVLDQEEELSQKIPFYRHRWSVKPGATGWAQVNRGYCETIADNTEKLSYDLFYIKNLSASFDLLILLKTIKILLLGRGAQ